MLQVILSLNLDTYQGELTFLPYTATLDATSGLCPEPYSSAECQRERTKLLKQRISYNTENNNEEII